MLKYATTNLKILIAIPTYKRAGNVTTLSIFDEPILFVDKSEVELYKKEYPQTQIVVYDGSAGLTPKLNFILDYAREKKYDCVFKVDDDFEAMACFPEGYPERTFDKEKIYQVIERTAVNARDAGTPLFTFLQTADIRRYKRNEPFSLFATLKIGSYGLFLDNDLRFDERLIMKQDIDMCLQVLLDFRMVWVENRYSFYCKTTMGTKGGVASYRTRDKEIQVMDILRKKWGDDTFSNKISKRSIYTLNIKNPFH